MSVVVEGRHHRLDDGVAGAPGDVPVAGDWNADGRDDVGVFRNGLFLLDAYGGDDKLYLYERLDPQTLYYLARIADVRSLEAWLNADVDART